MRIFSDKSKKAVALFTLASLLLMGNTSFLPCSGKIASAKETTENTQDISQETEELSEESPVEFYGITIDEEEAEKDEINAINDKSKILGDYMSSAVAAYLEGKNQTALTIIGKGETYDLYGTNISVDESENASDSTTSNMETVVNSKFIFKIPSQIVNSLDYIRLVNQDQPTLKEEVGYEIRYVVANYSNLCCLCTNYSLFFYGSDVYFVVKSAVKKENIKFITNKYNEMIDYFTQVPKNSDMTDVEKILYVHNKLVLQGTYADTKSITGRSYFKSTDYMPIGIMIFEEGVCQSYAAILNQLINACGIKSYIVLSDGHSWNLVKLGDKYYYIDATDDDPKTNLGLYGKDYVSYEFFLFNSSKEDAEHKLNAQYREIFSKAIANSGDEYSTFFPKKQNLSSAMTYIDGAWYYSVPETESVPGGVYCWDGKSKEPTLIINDPNIKATTEFKGTLYVTNNKELYTYTYDAETKSGQKEVLLTADNIGKVYSSGVILYLYKTDSATWEAYDKTDLAVDKAKYDIDVNSVLFIISPDSQEKSQQDEIINIVNKNTSSLSNTSTSKSVKKPAKVKKLKAKNKKSRKLVLTWKKVKGAKGYQVKYALNKKFTKKKKTKLVKKTKLTLKELKKKKTYYVKVRAYKLSGKKKIYGKWSKKVKVKIKK